MRDLVAQRRLVFELFRVVTLRLQINLSLVWLCVEGWKLAVGFLELLPVFFGDLSLFDGRDLILVL